MKIKLVVETNWTEEQFESWFREVINDANNGHHRGPGWKPPIVGVGYLDVIKDEKPDENPLPQVR